MGKQKEEEEKKDRTALLLQERKKIIYNLVLVVTASFVVLIGILTMAWFAMNKEGGTSGVSVTVTGSPFELAVPKTANVGSKSYIQTGTKENATYDSGTALNDMQNGANAGDGVLGTYTYITNLSSEATSSGEFYATYGSGDRIKWRLTDPENVNGLGPDSSGKLVFYIIPKRSGDLTIKFKLDIEGYTATVSKNENETFRAQNLAKIGASDSQYAAVTYLKRHLLFFRDWTGAQQEATEPYYYRNLIENGEFEITLTGCVADRLVPVTIYWIWPNTYAQMTCIAETGNVANTSSGATDVDVSTVNALRNYVISKRSEILKSSTDLVGLMTTSSAVEGETVYTFDPNSANYNVETLSLAYNLADQDIGTGVQYFLLTLSAE